MADPLTDYLASMGTVQPWDPQQYLAQQQPTGLQASPIKFQIPDSWQSHVGATTAPTVQEAYDPVTGAAGKVSKQVLRNAERNPGTVNAPEKPAQSPTPEQQDALARANALHDYIFKQQEEQQRKMQQQMQRAHDLAMQYALGGM